MILTSRLRLVLACLLLASFALTSSGCNKKRYRITETSTEYLYYARKVKEKKDGRLIFIDTLLNSRVELEPEDWELEEIEKKDFEERIDFHRSATGEMGGPDLRRIREAEEFPEDDG